VLHWEDSCTDNNLFFKPTKVFKYNGIPFTEAKRTSAGDGADCFVDEVSKPMEGVYEIGYKVTDSLRFLDLVPYRPRQACAKVQIFVKKEDSPQTIRDHKIHESKLASLTERLTDIREKVASQVENVTKLEHSERLEREQIDAQETIKTALREMVEAMENQKSRQQEMMAQNTEKLQEYALAITGANVESDVAFAQQLSELVVHGPLDEHACGAGQCWEDKTAELIQLWGKWKEVHVAIPVE